MATLKKIPSVIAKLKTGQTTLLGAISSLNLTGVAIMGVVVALYALYKAYDKANVTAEEQLEIFDELNTKYEATKSELDSLNSSLKSVSDRIKELNELSKNGSITPDQEKELDQLESEEKALKRQIKIKERLAEVDRKAAEKAAIETLEKRSHVVEGETRRRGSEVISSAVELDDAEAINYYIAKLEEAQTRKEQLENELADADLTDEQISQHNAEIEQLENQMTSYETAIGEIVAAVQPLLDSITATTGATAEQKKVLEDAITRWLNLRDTEEEVAETTTKIADAQSQVTQKIADQLAVMAGAEEAIGSLSEALGEFNQDGIVTASTLSGLRETFGNVGDAWTEFVAVAGDSSSTMSEVQSACNNLAEAYLDTIDFTSNMTDETKASTVAHLKQIGVLNAEEVVTDRLRIATDKLRQAEYNATVEALNYASANSQVVAGLIAQAREANIAAKNIAALEEIMAGPPKGMTGSEWRERKEMLLKEAQADLSTFEDENQVEISMNVSLPSNSSGKSAAEEAADKARDEFSKAYNAKKHELDMEKITIKEFYAWLDGQEGYKKYFEAQGETLEDFRKYSKEVFDGLRQVHEDYLDYLDYEISVLERQEDSENAVIAKYAEKRAELHKLAAELKAYLQAEGMSEVEILSNDQYRSYMDMIYSIEDEVASIQEEAYGKTQGYVNDLIDLTEDYIRKLKEDEIDALEDTKDQYAEMVDLQKALINGAREQDTYERDKADKLKEIEKLQTRIAALDRDGSREAMLEKGELMEELNALQRDLDDMQADHYVDTASDALDEAQKDFEKNVDEKIRVIEEFLDNNEAVNKAALSELDNMNEELFDNLMDYAMRYTDTTRAEMLAMWDEVTKAAEKYGSVTNASQVYEDSSDHNDVQKILNKMRENGQAYAASTDPDEKQRLADDSWEQGKKLEELLQVPVYRENGTWYIGTGASKRKLFEIYHTGTPAVGGFPSAKQNEIFSLLEKGETVFTEKHMDSLWSMLKHLNPANWISSPLSKRAIQTVGATASNEQVNVNVSFPLTIYGDMTKSTMSVIERKAYEVADIVASKLRR